MNSVSDSDSDHTRVTITQCPDGPLLIRGPVTLIGTDGEIVPTQRPTIALCQCKGTSIPPFCDGTHKKRQRRHR